MSEAARAIALAAAGLALALTFVSIRTAGIPASSPHRLVAELRLAQIAALVLVFVSGAYVGFVASGGGQRLALDAALAVGFFVTASMTLTRDPREALTILALAFGAHALLDILHTPALVAPTIAPAWYAAGCALLNVYVAALCYLPVLRR